MPSLQSKDSTPIETFEVRGDGSVEPTGDDDSLIELWQPAAELMAAAVQELMSDHGITPVGPGYLTTSALPLGHVSHDPHFDDDLYSPASGVGLVAIAATHAGTRLGIDPIEVPTLRPNLPIELSPELKGRFDSGQLPSVQSDPDRIVVFPQFGQLHSGPNLESIDSDEIRTLMVLRFQTAGSVQADQPRVRTRRRTRQERIG